MSEVYGEFADRNGWGPGQPLQRWLSRRILKEVVRVAHLEPSTAQLLEVGCGLGNGAIAAREMGFGSYVGVEPNARIAAAARVVASPSPVIEAALPNLGPDLHGKYDAVLAIHVIEHATSGYEAREWVEELARTLVPGGVVAIVSPDVRDFKAAFWDIDWSHGFPTTSSNLTQIVSDLGLEVVSASRMRLGSVRGITTSVGFGLSVITPARVIDAVSRPLVGRNLGTGFKTAVLWGVAFVVARKPLSA